MSHIPEAYYAVVEDRFEIQHYSQCSGGIEIQNLQQKQPQSHCEGHCILAKMSDGVGFSERVTYITKFTRGLRCPNESDTCVRTVHGEDSKDD